MKKELLSMLATGTVLLSTLTPAVLADSTFVVSGNGAGSQNDVSSSTNNASTLVQDNTANIRNAVSSNSNTGGNNADENTGGNVTVDTGNARSITDVQTRANANIADLSNCGCTVSGSTGVNVSGNGAQSNNAVSLNNTNTSSLFQTNNAQVTNDIRSNAQTGNNNANRNTGGDVLVLTGHAANDTMLRTAANANVASMGSGAGGNDNSGSLWIAGNGYGSNNSVSLRENNAATLVQGNQADITNRVRSNSQTGRNNANENTGGNVTVDTGNALNSTSVDTMANFNSADMNSCGCTLGGFLGKVYGNGAQSTSNLRIYRNDTMSVFQGGQNGNRANVVNDVSNNSTSGRNSAARNTGAVYGNVDPVDVVTGHTGSDTQVTNQTGVNMFGPHVQLPGGADLNFTFDLNGLLGSLHL